jgi:hypothetical protein
MKNFIVLSLILVSACSSEEKRVNQKEDFLISGQISRSYTSDPINERDIISFDKDSLTKSLTPNHYLIEKFNNEYKGLEDSDIVSIKLIDSVTIKKYGDVQIYNILLSDNLPRVFSKRNYLVVNAIKKEASLFLLDTLNFIKSSVEDTSVFLGGIEKINDKGFFILYDFVQHNKFKAVLNSSDSKYCVNGLPVFNNGVDCISYKPFMLTLKNIDINNDGVLDINFSGEIASYCKDLEVGFGRNDRNPLSLKKINFSFILQKSIADSLVYDFVASDSVCNKINN